MKYEESGDFMIEVSRLNDTKFWVSPDQIEIMEATPDTILTLVSGRKLIAKESPEVIRDRIIDYRRKCLMKFAE